MPLGRFSESACTIALCCAVAAIGFGRACATEFAAEPYASLKTLHNDNFTLTTGPRSDVWGALFSPGVRLSAESDNWKVTGGAELNFNRYSKDEFSTTEGNVTLRSDYRAERETFGFNAAFIRDNTLVGELATTGIVQAFSPRTAIAINPSWIHAFTEQTNLVVRYAFTDVNYIDNVNTGLIDYLDQIATAGVEHRFSERTVATLTGYYERFDTRPDNFSADTAGVRAGIIEDFSETLRASLAVGPRFTRSRTSSQSQVCNGNIIAGVCSGTVTTLGSEVKSDSSGFTLDANVTKRWATAQVSGQLSREINPSGVGSLVQTDLLRIILTTELSEVLSAFLDGGIYRSKYIGGVIAENRSTYLRVEPRVSWRISPSWTLDAGYIYARQKYETQNAAATADTIYLTLNYSWPKYSVSR